MAANDGYFDIRDYTGTVQTPQLPTGPAPDVVITAPQNTGPTPAAPQGGVGMGRGLIPAAVREAEQQVGRKLTMEELDGLGNSIKTQHLPALMPKGVQQWQFEQAQAGYDDAFNKYKEGYFAAGIPGQAQATAESNGLLRGLGDFAASVGSGAARGVIGGGLNLLDMAARNINSAVNLTREAFDTALEYGVLSDEYRKKVGIGRMWDDYRRGRGERTFLGDWGQGFNDTVKELQDTVTSNETLQGRQAIRQAWADDNTSVGKAIITMAMNPEAAVNEIGEVAGGFLGPGGVAKLTGAAKYISTLTPGLRRLASATVVGAPQAANSIQDWATFTHNLPMEELMKLEENQQLVNELRSISPYVTDQQIEKAVRDRTVATGYDAVAATSMLANVGLAALPYFKTLEQRLGGGLKPAIGATRESIGRAAGTTAVSEAVEETAAGALEQFGQNVGAQMSGQDVSLGQGVGKAAGQGGVMGLLTGGLTGPLGRTPARPEVEIGDSVFNNRRVASILQKNAKGAKLAAVDLAKFGFTPEEIGELRANDMADDRGIMSPRQFAMFAQKYNENLEARNKRVETARTVGGNAAAAVDVTGGTAAPAAPTGDLGTASPTAATGFDKIKKTALSALGANRRIVSGYRGDIDANGLVTQAVNDVRTNLGPTWDTLDQTQQLDLVAAFAEQVNKTRGKKALEGVTEAIEALRATVTAPAPAAAAPAATEVPLTPAEARPDVPEFDPNTATPPVAPAAEAPAAVQTAAPAPTQAAPTPAEEPTVQGALRAQQLAQLQDTAKAGTRVTASAVQRLYKLNYAEAAALAEEANKSYVDRQKTPAQKQDEEAQGWLDALMQRNEAANDETQRYRDLAEYSEMVKAFNEGKITNPGEAKAQLALAKKAVKNALPKVDWTVSGEGRTQRIGDLLAMKGRLKAGPKMAQQKAKEARAALISMGMKPEEVDALNLKGAMDAYQRLGAQGVRPAAGVARPQEETVGEPKETGTQKVKQTKGNGLKKQRVTPDGTVPIGNTKPEPLPVAGVNPLIQELKDKDGRRITRGQQIKLQATWDDISRTNKGSAALKAGIKQFTGADNKAVYDQLFEQAGQQYLDREANKTDTQREAEANAKQTAARTEDARDKLTVKGRAAAGVRDWIANLTQAGQRQRITEAQQKGIESLYSRMLVQGGAPATLYNAVEEATGNADLAQNAVDKFNTEFEALGDTPNVLALAKLANVTVSAPKARMLTDIATEQGDAWRSEDGRTALEVAVDTARRMKGDKLSSASKSVLRQAFDKEASRPKSQAPAQTKATGAEPKSLKAETPSAAELQNQLDRTVVEAEVTGILGDNALTNSMVRDIADAIVQSRLDQKAKGPALIKMVNELQREGDIDLRQAIQLRAAGTQVNLITADLVAQAAEEADPEVEENLDTEQTDESSPHALDTTAIFLNDFWTEQVIDAATAQPVENRAATLLRSIATMQKASDGQRWLANKLANTVQGLGIDVRWAKPGEHPSWGGWYNPNTNEVVFNVGNVEIVLHEMLHGVTSNMLTFAPNNPQVLKLKKELTNLRRAARDYWLENPETATDGINRLMSSNLGPMKDNDEFLAYGMTEKSFMHYLARIPYQGEKQSVWQGFKNAITNFFSPFSTTQRTALDALIDTTGQLVDMVAENPSVAVQANEQKAREKSDVQDLKLRAVNDGPKQKGEKTNIDMSAKDSKWRSFLVRYVDQTVGLEKVMQTLVKGGKTISKELNIARAKILFDGLKTTYTGEDQIQVINPVVDYLHTNLLRFGKTREEALERVNKFFRNKTQLNRYHMMWLENVRLKAGMDVQRQRILDEVSETPASDKAKIKELRSQLEQLVSMHREETEEEYGRKKNAHYDRFREGLAELEKLGVTEKTMAPLNAHLEKVRNRIQERTWESGKADRDDPWITFYDDKYYIPLKGDKQAANELGSYDFGAIDHTMSLNILNKSIEIAKGSTQPLTNGIERLLGDSIQAATRAAEKSFTSTLYDFVTEFQEELGANIRVYEGRPKEGYTQISGKEVGKRNENDMYDDLPGADGFTLSEGNVHYTVDLPKDSQLYHTLAEFYASVESWALTKAVGKATNFLSKSYTVWKPWWTLTTALVRDITYVPAMLGVKDDSVMSGIGTMGRYYVALAKNGMQLGNISTAVNMSLFEGDKLEVYAKANPDSFAAWLLRYQAAGGGTNIRGMYNSVKIRDSLTSGYDNADGLWKLTIPARYWDKWTTGLGNVLENTSRVAAFRALVEDGIKAAGGTVTPEQMASIEREAAIDTKGVLNYDQQGIWSKSVNSYLAFFKVGMTSTDAMRKSFINPDGSFAKARFAKWAGVFASIGFIGMAMTRAMGGDDEEDGKDKLSKISLNTLTQNFIVYIDGKPYKLPIGLGLPQLLLAPGIIAEAVENGSATPAEGGRALYEVFVRNSPLRPTSLTDDEWTSAEFVNSWWNTLTPSVIAPITQLAANKSTFGQDIHRDFTGSEQYASEQGKASTDEFWKDLAKDIREGTGGKVDFFPETLKHLSNSYMSMIPIDKVSKINAAADDASQSTVKEILNVEVRDPEYYYARQLKSTQDALLPAVQEFNLRKNQYLSEGMSDKAARAAATAAINSDTNLGPAYRAYKALDKSQREYYNERKAILRDKTLSTSRREYKMKQADRALRVAIEAAQKAM